MKININKYYSISELHKMNIFKWTKSYSSLNRLIKRDVKNGNKTFQAIMTGKGNGIRYFIKGSTIIKLLKEIEKGKIF